MDAQTFLDNFGTIADAPGGVDRLRELILDLAVRGQLDSTGPEDGIVDDQVLGDLRAGPAVNVGRSDHG